MFGRYSLLGSTPRPESLGPGSIGDEGTLTTIPDVLSDHGYILDQTETVAC